MRSIAEYIDLARSRQNFRSIRRLAQELEMGHSALLKMRDGEMYPSDEKMVRLAELAGADIQEALLNLNIWRSKSPMAKARYQDLKRSLARTAGAGLIAASVLIPHGKSEASTGLERESLEPGSVYIMLIQ